MLVHLLSKYLLSSLHDMRVCERSMLYQQPQNEAPVFGSCCASSGWLLCHSDTALFTADVPTPGGRTQQKMKSALCLALS